MASGNSSDCTGTVVVEDPAGDDPDFCGMTYMIPLDANGQAFFVASTLGTYSDNCGPLSLFVLGNPVFDCSNIGTASAVNIGIVDNNNNFSTCTVNVNVEDTEAPVANCKDITVSLDANGDASIQTSDIDDNSSDNCGLASMSVSPSDFDCSHIGANTVTLTVTDNGSNMNTCMATVTIVDSSLPTPAFCGTTIDVAIDASGLGIFNVNDLGVIPDNCGTASSSCTWESKLYL